MLSACGDRVSFSSVSPRRAAPHQFLLYPGDLEDSNYTNPELLGAIDDHTARVGDPAEQFTARVLIQPVVAWSTQASYSTPEQRMAALQCVEGPDYLQCDQALGWSAQYTDAVLAALTRPDTLAAMTGVDVATIAWMDADARAAAVSRGKGGLDETALEAVFGELASTEDYYYHYFQRGSPSGYSYGFPRYDIPFFRSLPAVRTLITDSGKDITVFTPEFPEVFATYTAFIAGAEYDASPVAGSERPGQIHVTYQDGLGLPDLSHTIRFPRYPNAGHMVTHLASPELLSDVAAWLAEP